MKRDLALKILQDIVKKKMGIYEIKLTEARTVKSCETELGFDVLIEDQKVSHLQIQELDELLADYDNIEMVIELSESQIRIFEPIEEKNKKEV